MSRSKNFDFEFRAQLEKWIKASGKQKATIAKLTRFLDFGDGSVQMAASTLAKSIRKPPVRREGKYNLYAILGVLYMLEVITANELTDFLNRYAISEVPDGRLWGEIWNAIEQGATKGRISLQSEPDKKDDSPIMRNRIKSITLIPILLILPGMIGILFIVVFSRPRSVQQRMSAACLQPIAGAAPTFVHEQGFSLYATTATDDRKSVLSNSIRSVGIDTDGIWVGYAPQATTIEGTSHYAKDEKIWTHCLGLPLSAGQNVNDIVFMGGVRYFSIDGIGVVRLDAEGWHRYTIDHGLPSNATYKLFIDSENSLWAATDGGVAKLIGERWETAYTAQLNELASNHVYQIYDDKAGNRWFGLINRGISRMSLNGEWFSYFTDVAGLQNVSGIAGDALGGVWFATGGGGLVRFYNNGQEIFSAVEGTLISDHVWDVERDTFDRLWIATDRGVAYTPDYGQNWIIHSTWATLDIEFGCPNCAYDETHLWLVLQNQGLGHVRIPPNMPTLQILSTPSRVQLKPGEEYIFEIKVQAMSEPFTKSDGLFSSKPADLYGAWHTIPVQGNVERGESYVFSNADTPIKAPIEPGVYSTEWRIWQGGRFVTDSIVVEFEVIDS